MIGGGSTAITTLVVAEVAEAAVYGTGIPVDPSMNMAVTVNAGAPSAWRVYATSEPTLTT